MTKVPLNPKPLNRQLKVLKVRHSITHSLGLQEIKP